MELEDFFKLSEFVGQIEPTAGNKFKFSMEINRYRPTDMTFAGNTNSNFSGVEAVLGKVDESTSNSMKLSLRVYGYKPHSRNEPPQSEPQFWILQAPNFRYDAYSLTRVDTQGNERLVLIAQRRQATKMPVGGWKKAIEEVIFPQGPVVQSQPL